MREAVITGAARTAIGSFMGSLADIPAPRLGAAVIAEAASRGRSGRTRSSRLSWGTS